MKSIEPDCLDNGKFSPVKVACYKKNKKLTECFCLGNQIFLEACISWKRIQESHLQFFSLPAFGGPKIATTKSVSSAVDLKRELNALLGTRNLAEIRFPSNLEEHGSMFIKYDMHKSFVGFIVLGFR